jgi:hypothetical protein
MGFIAGVLLGITLCNVLDLRTGVILLMGLTGAFVFFVLAIGAKVITGEETIVYYHHEIGIMVTCSIVLRTLHLPVLTYLDITLLGIATFLAFGRIGCYSVGCCHGRPAKRGVVYGHQHVESGFTFYYEGVPLLPVQLAESAFVFIIIISGTTLLLLRVQPGTVLMLYTVVYGAFRFIIEFFRGDPERGYYKGLSEAQWTTLILVATTLGFAFAGSVPLFSWHIAVTAGLFIISIYLVIKDSFQNRIFKPGHIRQIAEALYQLEENRSVDDTINICKTKQGLCLSTGQSVKNGILVPHHTISFDDKKRSLTPAVAEKLAQVIRRLQKQEGSYEIVEKENGIYHIIFSANEKEKNMLNIEKV